MSQGQNALRNVQVSADMLRQMGIFGGISDETLALLADVLPRITREPGDEVVTEGDTARDMYIVIGGELEVVKKSRSGSDVRVAVLGPGDWFGEMSILDVMPRSATVRTLAPTLMLRMGADHVEDLLYRRDLKSYSLLIMNIARELSRRLRVADAIVAQLMITVHDEYVRGSGAR